MPAPRLLRFRFLALSALTAACSSGDWTDVDVDGAAHGRASAALRDMTPAEATEDLEQLLSHVRRLYGPYEYKRETLGLDLDALQDEARVRLAEAPGDDGFYATARWFLTRLRDGHVSLDRPLNANPVVQYEIGIWLQPVEDRALVAEVLDASLFELGIRYGDEVLAIDGESPFGVLDAVSDFDTLGNEVSDRHWVFRAFRRPAFAESLRPTSPVARVDFRRADGSEYSRDLVWAEVETPRASVIRRQEASSPIASDAFVATRAREVFDVPESSLARLGAVRPFFVNQTTSQVFGFVEVEPNAALLARYGLDAAGPLPDVYAALYSFGERSILLVRQAGYDVENEDAYLAYHRALLDQYDDFVDGLVIDQTHNPGGVISYCTRFAGLFAQRPIENFVQAMNADRLWVRSFRDSARIIDPSLRHELSRHYELRASQVETAYDAGESITAPIPLIFDRTLRPDPAFVWTKPFLVLVDELAGSCGDVFPMLIKQNALAPLFGRRTMGLGGSVETFGPLPNSGASFSLTRGLFTTHRADETYATEDFVENRGVVPDIEHEITVDDFRVGFVNYVADFSQWMSWWIDESTRPSEPSPESLEPSGEGASE